MIPQELFETWAPAGAAWSAWAKPSLFAGACPLPSVDPKPWDLGEAAWAPPGVSGTAVIVDLPGEGAISCALRLAAAGFRPVPMLNTCTAEGNIIPLEGVLAGLRVGGAILRSTTISPDAPPAFVLDSRRLDGSPKQGDFDNRWAVFPQDFPSSSFMRSRSISRVVVVRRFGDTPRVDLLRVLSRWGRDGIRLEVLANDSGQVRPLRAGFGIVARITMAIEIASFGFRRDGVGGFGGRVPVRGGTFG